MTKKRAVKKQTMFAVSRDELMSWSTGEVLHFECGKGIAVDERACEEAIRRMNAGETIGLTVNRKVVSTMRCGKNGYDESEVS